MSKAKPVVKVTVHDMWDYEYQAKTYVPDTPEGELVIIASDSMENLKRYIRERTMWTLAWITTSSGALSYGQNIVDEYPYCPRRHSPDY